MNGACDQLLARARLAGNENGGICRSDFCDARQDGVQSRLIAYDLFEHRDAIYFVPQRHVFLLKLILERLDLSKRSFELLPSLHLFGDFHRRSDKLD